MHMLHHVSLGVSNIEKSAAFYHAVLLPLGYIRVWGDLRPGEADQAVGYGVPGSGDKFAIKFQPSGQRPPGPGFHLAFSAPNRKAVDGFHKAGLKLGGKDNGSPDLRPHYGQDYYAAFIIDLDGHHLEAVFKTPLP